MPSPLPSRLDLSFSRVVDVPPALIWRCWTEPALLMPWFCPAPWSTIACEIDLRPGGLFSTTMQSPEGQTFPNLGCYLEVVPGERLTWTNALGPGFRPMPAQASGSTGSVPFQFTATVALTPHGSGTRYEATVVHADEAACDTHRAMGFEEGWGIALDQMIARIRLDWSHS